MSSSNGKKEYIRLYKAFRQELDDMCVPLIIDDLKIKEPIFADGKFVGMIAGGVDYIDCVYVEPEYRRQGLAKKAVLKYCEGNYHYGIRLHIINNNLPALSFWSKIFKLEKIGENPVDSLYQIVSPIPAHKYSICKECKHANLAPIAYPCSQCTYCYESNFERKEE